MRAEEERRVRREGGGAGREGEEEGGKAEGAGRRGASERGSRRVDTRE
jgi:hypothetical protein